jgi:hypothetical protein
MAFDLWWGNPVQMAATWPSKERAVWSVWLLLLVGSFLS